MPSTFRFLSPGTILAVLLTLPQLSAADTEPAPAPWSQGVSPEDQQAAMALFEEAVTLQKQWLLSDAVARYEQALEHWEHPLIRFYLGRTREKMGDPVAAYENLRLALRWDMESFTPEEVAVAREMQQRLEAELTRLEVRCDEPGAQVFLDGKPWFVGPGRAQAMLRPGEHAVIARKQGHFTVTESISLVPGKHATAEIRLSPEAVVRRRWQRWGPTKTWVMVGTGAALALAGGALEWQAARNFDAYERQLLAICDGAPQCEPYESRPALERYLDRGRLQNTLAITAFSAAGVTLATGALLGWLDQPRSYRNQHEGGMGVELAPLVTQDLAGMSLSGWF